MALRIVIDRDIPFIRGVFEPYAAVEYLEGKAIGPSDLRNADALIVRTRTRCDRALLEGTGVRFIASATIGFDHIDTEYCAAAGITWTNAPGCNSSSVSQYVAAALDSIAGRMGRPPGELTVGVIGVGHVGTRVAAFCRELGLRVLLNDPPRERREGSAGFVSLARVMDEADILTLHVPLLRTGEDRTFHLFDDARLARLGPDRFLINTSRGEVVETEALVASLRDRHLAGTVLDVWEHEPGIDRDLLALAAIATPHIAGYSADGKANGTAMCVQALARHGDLPLRDWFPPSLPAPAAPYLLIDGARSVMDAVLQAVRHTYDILRDDRELRANPEKFESLRAHYPVRREFPAHRVTLRNTPPAAAATLRRIGFQVEQ